MSKQEITKLIMVIKAVYPNHFQKYTNQDTEYLIAGWKSILEDYTYEQANAGLKVYLSGDNKGFPPSPGQIIDCIHKLNNPAEEMTALEAWQYVAKAISNGLYHAEEEYAKLPPLVQKAVGNPATIREWAGMDSDTVHSVEQSHFIRTFDKVVKKDKELAKIPLKIREAIGVATAGMING